MSVEESACGCVDGRLGVVGGPAQDRFRGGAQQTDGVVQGAGADGGEGVGGGEVFEEWGGALVAEVAGEVAQDLVASGRGAGRVVGEALSVGVEKALLGVGPVRVVD
ncbi:hypothetical protein J7E99_20690 [Streptomyces sp. ISL-44]|uniref:hypothetical protein n=1 Tax=Streptomyces sp. ISL-44 TaxID=2819184 RepID=UPI001BE8D6CD|nr:hypothetical protein [Streptomyces sp. ISL-44]MBT2543059.1 hypothetical protein [Streptomyces sp. ISL-44]